jgi:hypothetical protein
MARSYRSRPPLYDGDLETADEHRFPMVPATPEQEQQLEAIVKRYSLFVGRPEIAG